MSSGIKRRIQELILLLTESTLSAKYDLFTSFATLTLTDADI